MKNKKREIDVVVISDVHLGTYGSHAQEFHQGSWRIYYYHADDQPGIEISEEDDLVAQIEDLDSKDIFRLVQKEFLI